MDEIRIKISLGLMKRLEAAAAADDRTVDEALLVAVRTWVEAIERQQDGRDGQMSTDNCGTGADGGETEGTRGPHDASEGGAEEDQE